MTPIWMMRQAGRYLPEYQKIRKKAGGFLSLCKNPDLACEVTLQPFSHFPLDAAILFSDILTIPDAMGLGLYFSKKQGPIFERPIRNFSDINKLPILDPEQELGYVINAVRAVLKALNGRVPLIGFSGSPWTLSTYMVEGRSSKSFSYIKKMMYMEPKILHVLLDKLAKTVILYLNAQIEAGVQSIMIFDTWGGVLTKSAYNEFSLYYIQQIIDSLHRKYNGYKVPITLFTKGGGQWLELMAMTGCDALSIDWMTSIDNARSRVGNQVALQGNMDPAILYASSERIEREVAMILKKFGQGSGHVFSLGHGINQDIMINNINIFVHLVHELSKQYH
ncbi:uroporphyrinogen decarboxylase [Arsenophonus symbiont of Ornithomya chloropus]|uniref:uroporphyrinogen decarboxylase n=1 Tax=Arsenophonus symbiont of Ornithomya chloropus TaxID=634121 RepID=UPI0032B2008B